MKTIDYQISAVKELKGKTLKLLSTGRRRRSIIFKAPTGAGKTVMASMYLGEITEELEDEGGAAFIWIAPNKLHEQSYFKIKTFFDETRTVRPATFDDLTDNSIKPGDVLFLNWESINKDNAVIIRDNELDRTLYQCVKNTRRDYGCPIIVIIDEEHMFAGKNAKKAQKVLDNIDADIELRISATPISQGDEMVNVPRQNVIAAEMIKKGVILNKGVEQRDVADITSSQYLTELALAQCDELRSAYQKLGEKINPLLLIQMPNDDSDKLNEDDMSLKDDIIAWLNSVKGINVQNGQLAIWLSDKKENLEGIEKNDSLVKALIFKQAIALGWDCPRAGVLLIFRKTKSYQFTTQTVGRILRMPQQKFYADDQLNLGYVFTDVNTDMIEIVREDTDYLSTCIAFRRSPFDNITLQSAYGFRPSESRNRLRSNFKSFMANYVEKKWLSTEIQLSFLAGASEGNKDLAKANLGINFDVKTIFVEIAEETRLNLDANVNNSDIKVYSTTDISGKKVYPKISKQLSSEYKKFIKSFQGGFEKEHFEEYLGNAIEAVFEDYFHMIAPEFYPVLLAEQGNNPENANNKPKFADLITKILDEYLKDIEKKRGKREFKSKSWEIPAERLYFEDSNEKIPDVKNHALMAFYRQKNASNPEVEFEQFLEQNTQYIDWWYKNGDRGSEHFAIRYGEGGSLFYPDFVIRMKNGVVCLFDTKREQKLFPETVEKHNALFDYLQEFNGDGAKNYIGGIIMRDTHGNWLYPPGTISSIDETFAGWTAFFPDKYA